MISFVVRQRIIASFFWKFLTHFVVLITFSEISSLLLLLFPLCLENSFRNSWRIGLIATYSVFLYLNMAIFPFIPDTYSWTWNLFFSFSIWKCHTTSFWWPIEALLTWGQGREKVRESTNSVLKAFFCLMDARRTGRLSSSLMLMMWVGAVGRAERWLSCFASPESQCCPVVGVGLVPGPHNITKGWHHCATCHLLCCLRGRKPDPG